MYGAIMEFAKNYFNNHDKSSDGTFIATAINYIYARLFLQLLTSHHTEIKQPRYCNDKQNMFLILYFINPNSVEWNTALTGDFKLSHVTWRISASSENVVLSRHLVELTLS
ncbi:hypothetical protein GQX74_015712 [Glossina fuscipes]|nr:hypothetical protein GQX74_015712 [Glossina fuscipes]